MAESYAALIDYQDLGVICARLIGAALLCALIGFEREARDHAAGLRTNMLVGFAAATFALITLSVVQKGLSGAGESEALSMDPLRLVEAVTGGVAFLAAGMIVFAKGRVHGLTTGASMWLSASVGLASGLGLWVIAVPAAIGGFVILTLLRVVEKAFGIRGSRRYGNADKEQDG